MTDDADELRAPPGVAPEVDGGDPACWLAQVCQSCGALVEGVRGTPCWRCGVASEPGGA